MGFPLLLLLTLLFLLLQPFSSIANLDKFNTLLKSNLSEQVKVIHKLDDKPPMEFFEVKKPIKIPHTLPCTHQILQHKFGYTSDMKQPTVYAAYIPPSETNCPSRDFSKIILEWTATCKGRQIGKIFGVWLGGVELLRGCTAEPIRNGIVWTVKKDIITRYYSLLVKTQPQALIVFLDNIVDKTVYDVIITIHFYPTSNIPAMAGHADLILPILEDVRANEGLWFHINKATQSQSKVTTIHKISFQVINALNVWLIDANLHLWVDHKSEKTTVTLLPGELSHLKLNLSYTPHFEGLSGTFETEAKRSIFSSGSAVSSYGSISSYLSQELEYSNSMIIGNDGNLRKLKQDINLYQKVYVENPTSSNHSYLMQYWKKFGISLEINNVDGEDGIYSSESKVELSIHEDTSIDDSHSSLQNQQIAEGSMSFKGDNNVVSASGNTKQEYSIRDFDSCYWRKVHSKDCIIFGDEEGVDCTNN